MESIKQKVMAARLHQERVQKLREKVETVKQEAKLKKMWEETKSSPPPAPGTYQTAPLDKGGKIVAPEPTPSVSRVTYTDDGKVELRLGRGEGFVDGQVVPAKSSPGVAPIHLEGGTPIEWQDYYQKLHDYRSQLQISGTEQDIQKAHEITKHISEVEGWHRKTVVREVKTDTGYEYKPDFPFVGAEKYYYYKSLLESDPGRATALGWGWGGYGNVDIAFYKLTGQSEKALEKQIGQLARYDYAQQQIKSGDIGGFSTTYWLGYMDSPATQIGLAYVGGMAVGKYTALKGTVAAATTGKVVSGITGKVITYGIGAGLVGYKTYDVAKSVERGDIGEAVGKTWLFGTTVVSGVAGFQTGAELGRIAAEPRIARYFEQHPEQYRMYHYHPGQRVGYDVEGKMAYRVGTPVERTSLQLKLTETYKPTKDIIATTKPYQTGLQEYRTAFGFKPSVSMETTATGTLTSRLKVSLMNVYKSVVDKPVNKYVERVTRWGVNVFQKGEPLGGIYKTINVPKININVPMSVSKDVLFPVTSFTPASAMITTGLGAATISSVYKYSPPKFESIQIPKFDTVQIPSITSVQTPRFEMVQVPKVTPIHIPRFDMIKVPRTTPVVTPKMDYIYRPRYDTVVTPVPFTPTPPIVIPPPLPLIGGYHPTRMGYRIPRHYLKGYQYREWKVPKLEDVLPDYKKIKLVM